MKNNILLISLFAATLVYAQLYEPTVIWDRIGETDSSAYGYKILPLGDQNDDGFADWAVLARGNVATYHGIQGTYLEFFYGGSNLSTEPSFVLRQDTSLYYQTWFATEAGDLNGDGYVDWYVSFAPRNSPGSRTYGFFWGGNEPSDVPDFLWPSATGWYRMQDFNGDGYDDLYSTDAAEVGRMYFGGNPMDTIPDWILYQPPEGLIQSIPYAVSDFTGDGASDFICFNPNPPYNIAVFTGGSNPDTVPAYSWSNMPRPIGGVKSITGNDADEWLASAVNGANVFYGQFPLQPNPNTFLSSEAAHQAVSAGDFNNDGYNDLILYTPTTAGNMFGALTLHLGHPWLYPNPTFEIQGSWPDGLIGIYSAAGLGDVNGDSIEDIAIGAWDDFAYLGWRGRCIIVAGDDSLIADADNLRPEIPQELEVEIYPNPFNSETTIRLETPLSPESVTLTVFNVLGQEVRHEVLPPFSSNYTYHFNAQDLTTGLYFIHAESGQLQTTQKLMLLR